MDYKGPLRRNLFQISKPDVFTLKVGEYQRNRSGYSGFILTLIVGSLPMTTSSVLNPGLENTSESPTFARCSGNNHVRGEGLCEKLQKLRFDQ